MLSYNSVPLLEYDFQLEESLLRSLSDHDFIHQEGVIANCSLANGYGSNIPMTMAWQKERIRPKPAKIEILRSNGHRFDSHVKTRTRHLRDIQYGVSHVTVEMQDSAMLGQKELRWKFRHGPDSHLVSFRELPSGGVEYFLLA